MLRIFLLLLLNFHSSSGFAQEPTIAWSKMYGIPDANATATAVDFEAIKVTADGGFVMAGSMSSNSISNCGNTDDTSTLNVWVVKCDAFGNEEWQRCYGGDKSDYAADIIQMDDGGYVLLAVTYSNSGDVSGNHSSGQDYWLVRLDHAGNIMWQKCYGGNNSDVAKKLIKTSWNRFVMIGTSNSYPSGDITNHHGDIFNDDVWIAITDSNGVLLHEHSFGGTKDEVFPIIYETKEQDLLVGVTTYSTDGDVNVDIQGLNDLWLLKIDSSLNILWQKSKGGNVGESGKEFYQLNNKYIVVGGTGSTNNDFSSNHGEADVWMLITDTAGNTLEQFLYGGSKSETAGALEVKNNWIYISCRSNSSDGDVSSNYGKDDYWLIITDTSGNLLYEQNYGGSEMEFFTEGQSVLVNGKLIMMGFSQSEDFDVMQDYNGIGGTWVIALDLLDDIEDIDIMPVSIVPNPFDTKTLISIPSEWLPSIQELQLVSTTGQIFMRKDLISEKTILECDNLPSGMYVLRIITGKALGIYKVVIQ